MGEIPPPVKDHDDAVQEYKHKNLEVALFNCVYGEEVNSEQQQFVVSHIHSKDSTGRIVQPAATPVEVSTAPQHTDDSVSNSQASNRIDMLRQLQGGGSLAGDSLSDQKSLDEAYEDITSLEAWQAYTIDCMKREKNGPKKTLPVLSTSQNSFTGNRKQFTGGRARRWGGGALIQLPGDSEEGPITGPSSYLDVYKTNFKIRSSAKERNKIAAELKTKRLENIT